jgi:uncharacterized protein (TIGR02246 family)
MRRHGFAFGLAVAAGVYALTVGSRPPAVAQPPAAAAEDPAAGIRKNADDYAKAFNAGDAKSAAACWTPDGEYTDTDGQTHRGRPAIEAELAAFLKAHPKATIEIAVESVRPLGRFVAVAEGVAKTKLAGESEPETARFAGTFVKDDDGWKIAALRDWVPDPATDVSLKDLAWLVGEWTAKGDAGELRTSYAWDDAKAFLTSKYSLSKDGKPGSSGTQTIANNPAGGLRSWQFDSTGTVCESQWTRDGNRWVVEATGTLPDGTVVTAVNLFIPLGPDAFTWQSTNRTAAGTPVPDLPPVKVTRVKK